MNLEMNFDGAPNWFYIVIGLSFVISSLFPYFELLISKGEKYKHTSETISDGRKNHIIIGEKANQ